MIAAAAAALLAQAVASEPAFYAPAATLTVPARYRLVEGVASDGATIWLTSVIDRKVIKYRAGKYRDFALPAGVCAPLGIVYDPTRRWLWIAAHCPDGLLIEGCSGAALIGMDRRGLVRVTVRPTGAARFSPGDVSVSRGRVFVSDSMNGAFYTCEGTCRTLKTLIAPRAKGSAQGSVAYDSGRKVLLADYSLGMISIDLLTGAETQVLTDDGRPLRGVDGLIADGDTYLGVRNFEVPGDVVRFRVAQGRLVELSVAAAGGAIHDPTQIVRAGKRILVVGDGQWATHLPDRDGKQAGAQKLTPIAAFPARNPR